MLFIFFSVHSISSEVPLRMAPKNLDPDSSSGSVFSASTYGKKEKNDKNEKNERIEKNERNERNKENERAERGTSDNIIKKDAVSTKKDTSTGPIIIRKDSHTGSHPTHHTGSTSAAVLPPTIPGPSQTRPPLVHSKPPLGLSRPPLGPHSVKRQGLSAGVNSGIRR